MESKRPVRIGLEVEPQGKLAISVSAVLRGLNALDLAKR